MGKDLRLLLILTQKVSTKVEDIETNLGALIDFDLSFNNHVKAVTKSAVYHLKNIAKLRPYVKT